MRRLAALTFVLLNLAACGVEPESPQGFEPAGTPTPKADGGEAQEELTPCHAVGQCISLECGRAMILVYECGTPEGAAPEGCATADAELESCVDACSAEHPEASASDVMLALAHQQCGVAAVTAEESSACEPLAVECHGFD